MLIKKSTIIVKGNGVMKDGEMTVAINMDNKATAPLMLKVVKELNTRNKMLAKANCRLDYGYPVYWPMEHFDFPDYQETRLHNDTAKKCREDVYKNEKEDVKKAFYDPATGKALLLDGKGTWMMHHEMGVPDLLIMMYPLMDEDEAARLFATQYDGCSRLAVNQRHTALVSAHDELACGVENVLNEFNITHKADPNHTLLRNMNSVRKPLSIAKKHGVNGLRYTLNMIELADWGNSDPRAYIEVALTIGATCLDNKVPEGSAGYNNVLRVMKQQHTINGYVGMANANFSSESVQHGPEQNVKAYTQALAKEVK